MTARLRGAGDGARGRPLSMRRRASVPRQLARLLLPLLLLVLWRPASADPAAPVAVRLNLTHVGADSWRADYVFAEAVDSLRMGPPIGGYRKQAWRVVTPGAALVEADGQESIRSDGKPMSVLSVDVTLAQTYAQGNYTPFDRFSDGGTDVYMGFFVGEAIQGGRARPLRLDLHLIGLPGETALAPMSASLTSPAMPILATASLSLPVAPC